MSATAPAAPATSHFHIECAPGSFAEARLGQIGTRLESAYAVIARLLGTDEPQPPIDVHLMDQPVTSRSPNRITELFSPESPAPGLERSLLAIVLARTTQRQDGVAAFLIDGLMAQLVQQLRMQPASPSAPRPNGTEAQSAGPSSPTTGPSAPLPITADSAQGPGASAPRPGEPPPRAAAPPPQLLALLQARAADRLPPIRTLLNGPTPATRPLYFAAAASFMEFLLRTSGPRAFLTFAAQASTETLDAAAQAAYQQSFGRLEKRWQSTLKPPRAGGVTQLLRGLAPYLRSRWLRVLEVVIEIAASVAFTTFVATQQQVLMDAGILQGNLGVVIQVIAQLVVLFAIVSLISLRQNYAIAQLAQSVLREIRLRMFGLVQRLEPAFFQSMQAGDILTRMTSDLSSLETTIGMGLAQGVRTILMIIIPGAALIHLNPRFALLLLLGTPLFFVAGRYFGPRTARASRTRQQDLAALTTLAQEDLAAHSVVSAFGLEELLVQRYARELGLFIRSALRLSILSGLTGLAAQSITIAIQLTALGVGAWLIVVGNSTPLSAWINAGGAITPGSIGAILSLMAQIVGAVQGMNTLLQMFQQATGPMDRVHELLNAQPKIADLPDASPIPRASGAIRLEGVWFGYEPRQPVLRNVNIEIPVGTSVGLVGPSGSGKSTILGLIQRFYDPQRGGLSIDATDIRRATLGSLRSQEGIVFQESVLFNVSIRENIRMGKLDATDAEVEAAARQAEIHDVIMALPEGYDTLAGDRGGRLSGGQRQRVAIARAIVRNPSILLLDEATSALDPGTEAAINATLRRLAEGRTTISVTHRLAGVMHADRIYVLDRGTVVESGTHADLLQRNGLYARLWNEQIGAAAPTGLTPDAARLQKVPLFAGMPAEELAGLARQLRAERFAPGDDIIHEDDIGDKLYLLERGEVEVVHAEAGGPELRLATLREGDYFGDVALLHDVKRTASVRAVTPVLVDSLGKDDFLRELQRVPGLRQRMEQRIGERTAAAASRGNSAPA
ncbi:MAG: ATP-binding cassette domain-containing protein [Chloroflexi bacterium]|nr:ATP-binding cassette domain-containing protein [Chloroflexota bacterium]